MTTKDQWLEAIDETARLWAAGESARRACPLCRAVDNPDGDADECGPCVVTRVYGGRFFPANTLPAEMSRISCHLFLSEGKSCVLMGLALLRTIVEES